MADGQDSRQSIVDGEHLKLLAIGFYVSAALSACFSLIGLVYMVLGIVLAATGGGGSRGNELPATVAGWIFGGIGCGLFVLLMAGAILKFIAGRCIAKRRHRVYCMVIGAISCLEMPYGTLLGVFTLIVLGKLSVKAAFDAARNPPPEVPPAAQA